MRKTFDELDKETQEFVTQLTGDLSRQEFPDAAPAKLRIPRMNPSVGYFTNPENAEQTVRTETLCFYLAKLVTPTRGRYIFEYLET